MSRALPGEPAEGLIAGILQRDEQTVPDEAAAELLTFLIADIRGYTRFTQERGDEAAAKLTAKLAAVVRDVIARFGGTVTELRGDEALCVFTSPRQSLRVAVALQQRFVAETVADADLPMTVGIGVDVGEAVHGPDGYRGGALNLAARLCEQARAGEVLASHEVTHLARTIDGIRYISLDRVTIKGLTNPVRPVRVLPEGEDPVRQIAALLAAATPPPSPPRAVRWLPAPLARRPRTTMIGAAVIAAALIAATVVAISRNDNGASAATLGENSVGVLNPSTGRLDAQVGVDVGPAAAAAGFGSVWTVNTDANTVSRVDTSSRQVNRITVGPAPSAIAVGPDSVWVANSGNGTVSRISPTDYQVQTVDVGSTPAGLAIAGRSVWVTNSGDGTVSRIDPSQNKAVETIGVGSTPTGISAGRDVWVANSASNSVSRIDGRNHAIVETIPVGSTPKGVAVVGGNVWVTNNLAGTVTRIATGDTTTADTVRVGPQPTQLTAVDGRVWVATQGNETLAEIDPKSRRVVRTVRVGAIPGGVADVGGKLWVTTTINPALHAGGVVRIRGDDMGALDPVYIGSVGSVWLINSSYDGLLGFRHASGADGTAIVPDLATAIPTPTNNGRTYTFQLRDGIKWSTGTPVTVFDVQHGIQRAIAAPVSDPLKQMIVGARGCNPKRCVIPGITVDAIAHSVTITLQQANAEFTDDLAVSTFAAPTTTPLANQMDRPIPATGPYQVAREIPGKLAVLTRNPYFHEWSAEAQPAGFPDRIEWQVDPQAVQSPNGVPNRSVDAVEAGHSDWADARRAAPLGALEARFGARLHRTPTETLHGLSLNTRIPPFNDVRVRQALALAIDRDAIKAHWSIPAEITCQFLPPNYPGYRPYCPYTQSPDETGIWHGSDFTRALALVKASHTTGMAVTVYASTSTAAGMRDVVKALKDLGYRASIFVDKDDLHHFSFAADTRNNVQAASFGWVSIDPSAANFLTPWSCAAITLASTDNLNTAQFCDPAIDHVAKLADRAQTTSLAEANELWAQEDRRLVDAEPWIPLVTPTWVDAVSTRVHNYKRNLVIGPLYDQMWVR